MNTTSPVAGPTESHAAGLTPAVAGSVYRAMLEALSRPGTRVTLPHSGFPPVLLPVLALADLETPVHLTAAGTPWRDVVTTATGAPHVSVARARFVTALEALTPETVVATHPGTPLAPEAAALVIAPVESLDDGPALTFRGPGVDGVRTVFAAVDAAVWPARDEHAAFPAGIDLLFVTPDGDALGVPRTTRIARKEN
ncbi:phosphonate C-P lyase system protein PhnH [Rhodococcus sp. HNM0569]|uniref:phosphonate C-P lyase system protein PhnH n=1 Tax=Rhodococcus sp. HNM0569 TaxID=2716340 RepID=UPI00146B98F7|nr:phosphonate C-P lyase system protein PhnH [Rhodococcus sp. HNM0569]